MTQLALLAKIEQLKDLEKHIREVEQVAEQLRSEIKNQMILEDTEEICIGKHIVRWSTVLTQRFDSTTFKREFPEVYRMYMKQTTSRRFSIG